MVNTPIAHVIIVSSVISKYWITKENWSIIVPNLNNRNVVVALPGEGYLSSSCVLYRDIRITREITASQPPVTSENHILQETPPIQNIRATYVDFIFPIWTGRVTTLVCLSPETSPTEAMIFMAI